MHRSFPSKLYHRGTCFSLSRRAQLARESCRPEDKLKRYLQDSAESAKSTAPSRGALWARLSKSCCFNAAIMSRARKQAVGGVLQVPLEHVPHSVTGRVP